MTKFSLSHSADNFYEITKSINGFLINQGRCSEKGVMELQYAQIFSSPVFDLYARRMSVHSTYYAFRSRDMI
jgi:hypothetical protein